MRVPLDSRDTSQSLKHRRRIRYRAQFWYDFPITRVSQGSLLPAARILPHPSSGTTVIGQPTCDYELVKLDIVGKTRDGCNLIRYVIGRLFNAASFNVEGVMWMRHRSSFSRNLS